MIMPEFSKYGRAEVFEPHTPLAARRVAAMLAHQVGAAFAGQSNVSA